MIIKEKYGNVFSRICFLSEVWNSFPIDPSTGYAVDPNTGDMVDPVTGAVIGGSYDENAEEPDVSPSPEASADPEGYTGDTGQ